MSNPKPKATPYQHLYKRRLKPAEAEEMHYNLTGYIRVLIEMDKQYQEWLKKKELHNKDKT